MTYVDPITPGSGARLPSDIVRALRDELQSLTNYLRRTAVYRTPPRAVTPHLPPRIQLVDRPAGDSVIHSLSLPGVVEVVIPAASLHRSISNVGNISVFTPLRR